MCRHRGHRDARALCEVHRLRERSCDLRRDRNLLGRGPGSGEAVGPGHPHPLADPRRRNPVADFDDDSGAVEVGNHGKLGLVRDPARALLHIMRIDARGPHLDQHFTGIRVGRRQLADLDDLGGRPQAVVVRCSHCRVPSSRP